MSPRLSLLLLAALLAPLPLAAQVAAPSPDAPPVSTAPAPKEEPQEEESVTTLKVTARLVSLYFTVKDKKGALVPYLTQNDCTVFDEKQPQKIKNFSAEANQPLTLGILLDTSGSQQYVLPMEQQAGGEFLDRILRQKDQAFLISFDVDVNLLQDSTNSARLLKRAMDKAEINTAGGNGAGGIPGAGQGPVPIHGDPKGTLLYDAVDLTSREKMNRETGRKALIILTDGQDQGSRIKLAGAIESAQKANAIVYVILIADRGFYGGIAFGYSGDSAMKKMAEETGGRVIDVGNNGKKLEAAFAQIEAELRTQYVASYTPDGSADGKYHHVDIQCKGDGLKIQSRKGYYALVPEE